MNNRSSTEEQTTARYQIYKHTLALATPKRLAFGARYSTPRAEGSGCFGLNAKETAREIYGHFKRSNANRISISLQQPSKNDESLGFNATPEEVNLIKRYLREHLRNDGLGTAMS